MTQQFKVGDKVKTYRGDTGIIVKDRGDSIFDVAIPGRIGPSSATPGALTYLAGNLTKVEPAFKVGDRVSGDEGSWKGTVVGFGHDPERYVVVKRDDMEFGPACDSSGKNPGAGTFVGRHLTKIGTEFKLKPGDRVKNLKTGRIGIISGDLKVHALVSHDVAVGNYACDAAALEAWEAEHPGTYDLVFEESAPW